MGGGLREGGLHHGGGDGGGGGEVEGLLEVGEFIAALGVVLGHVVGAVLLRIGRLRRLVILGVLDVEMLQTQPPADLALLEGGHVHGDARVPCQPVGGKVWVTDGGRQTDTAGGTADEVTDTGELADDLVAAIRAREGVDLVDDDVAEVTEQAQDIVGAVDKHGLQGLGSDLENARGLFQELFLVGLGHVPVPSCHADARHVQKLLHAPELVVDEGFQGADVQRPHAHGRVLAEIRENGEKGRLGLAAGGGGGEQEVVVGQKQRPRRRHLHPSQGLPAVGEDVLTDEFGEAGKYAVGFGHNVSFPEEVPCSGSREAGSSVDSGRLFHHATNSSASAFSCLDFPHQHERNSKLSIISRTPVLNTFWHRTFSMREISV